MSCGSATSPVSATSNARPVRAFNPIAARMVESCSRVLHRLLVPQPNQVSVRIGKLGPVTPVGLARSVRELNATVRPFRGRSVDILHLKPQRALIRHYSGPNLL